MDQSKRQDDVARLCPVTKICLDDLKITKNRVEPLPGPWL